jgi:hypothetical protein
MNENEQDQQEQAAENDRINNLNNNIHSNSVPSFSLADENPMLVEGIIQHEEVNIREDTLYLSANSEQPSNKSNSTPSLQPQDTYTISIEVFHGIFSNMITCTVLRD